MGFNKATIYTTVETIIEDGMGGYKTGYSKGIAHKVELQPIENKGYSRTWGLDVTAKLQIIDDVNCLFLKAEDLIIYKDKTYKIEKNIEWDNYSMYAIIESDKVIL